ncbi:hypothetical protein F4824DRAFT_462434 [Ustulina deusta]|nr:hypothetical protein F4824DRAFT_462434 [Ustulina deusta]
MQSRLNYQSTSPYRPTTAESHRSSSSETFSSTSSLNNELSQLVIEHDDPLSSQLVTAQTWHSSSSENFSSTSSLDDQLSQLAFEHAHPPSSQLAAAESNQSWQPSVSRTLPPRPTTAASYYSSSSEILSSISDPLDDVFSQPATEEETPQSSQSTTQDMQSSQPRSQTRVPSECSDSSIPTTPVRELEAVSPVYGSPSSTGKLSFPSPIQTPTRSPPSSLARPPQSPRSPQSPRLYRTRSGSLASVAELRQRREREEELLDIVLRGIKVLGDVQIPSPRRSIAMRLDESGRWRINSIHEPWGP